jgi:uncharacterized membrane protein
MEVEGSYFTGILFWICSLVSLSGVLLALKIAPWKLIGDKEHLHVFLGATVFLMVMWMIRAPVHDGIEFHLLFLTSLTLMFGWSLAVLSGTLALAGLSFAGVSSVDGLLVNIATVVLLPVTFSQIALVLIRHWFPRHFFIYIYLNAFLSGGLAILASSFLSSLLLSLTGLATFTLLWNTYLTYFPMMFFPEAVLNGWFMTLLVSYRPQWVISFRDEDYLHGK